MTGLTGFKIYRAVGSTAAGFVVAGEVEASTLTLVERSLQFNTTYYYRVTAVDANGNESTASSTVSQTTDKAP